MMEKTTCVFAVAKSGLVPVRKCNVKKETDKTLVLEDGTVVRKRTMSDRYTLFFVSEQMAEITHQNLSCVFDPEPHQQKTNCEVMRRAGVDEMAVVLFNMIQELCEDGMPTQKEIENWLMSASKKVEE